MNPIERQNLINQQSRPWHERLTSILALIWQGIVWWFTDSETEAHLLWQARIHLEQCWELPVQEREAQGND